MPAPLSPDLRIRLVNWYTAGKGTLREAAELFEVGEATAQRWVALFQRSGDVEPLPMGGARRQRRLAETDHDAIHRMLLEDPSLTVLEVCDRLAENGGPSVSRTTMTRALARLDLTRKKTLRGSRPSRRRASSP